MNTIYLLLTNTNSVLSTMIGAITHDKYNHISIALDQDLTEVYSFGRLEPNNPLHGGFTKEDVVSDFFSRANCQIHELQLTNEQYNQLLASINKFKRTDSLYRYNLLGLVPAARKIPWDRDYYYFCSEFVATVLIEAGVLNKNVIPSILTPQQVLRELDASLIYEGTLYEYKMIPKGRSTFRRAVYRMKERVF